MLVVFVTCAFNVFSRARWQKNRPSMSLPLSMSIPPVSKVVERPGAPVLYLFGDVRFHVIFLTSLATRSPRRRHCLEARSSGAPIETGP